MTAHVAAVLPMLSAYFGVTLLIGWLARRRTSTANSFLNATHSLPLPVVTAAYIAANCGALEILGLSAMAAEYGVQAFHFYWIGAIPAMIFLGLWMMPVYRRSGIRSVPEYLELRYGPGVRLLNACVVALTVLLLGGISLYAMAQVLGAVLGVPFLPGVVLSSSVVLAYVLLGGLRATIYNEVFQLAVMIAGLLPLAIRFACSPDRLQRSGDGLRNHLWAEMPLWSARANLDSIGVIVGLGFVLGFGYWCTDFVLMQRAFAARTDEDARLVPLWAAFGKILFSMLVVVPGIAAAPLVAASGRRTRFDQALPLLMSHSYGPVLLGLGLTALSASLMSGFAANLSAFSSLWTQDIYRTTLRPGRPDEHYLRVGRASSVAAALLCVVASYITFLFGNLMEHVQLIFAVFGSPFWAIFLLGVGTRRATSRGAVEGFASGVAAGILHLVLSSTGVIRYGSVMNANFHGALYSFATAVVVGYFRSPAALGRVQPRLLVFHWAAALRGTRVKQLWGLCVLLLLVFAFLNWYWR